jgi:hypothetical protein
MKHGSSASLQKMYALVIFQGALFSLRYNFLRGYP